MHSATLVRNWFLNPSCWTWFSAKSEVRGGVIRLRYQSSTDSCVRGTLGTTSFWQRVVFGLERRACVDAKLRYNAIISWFGMIVRSQHSYWMSASKAMDWGYGWWSRVSKIYRGDTDKYRAWSHSCICLCTVQCSVTSYCSMIECHHIFAFAFAWCLTVRFIDHDKLVGVGEDWDDVCRYFGWKGTQAKCWICLGQSWLLWPCPETTMTSILPVDSPICHIQLQATVYSRLYQQAFYLSFV